MEACRRPRLSAAGHVAPSAGALVTSQMLDILLTTETSLGLLSAVCRIELSPPVSLSHPQGRANLGLPESRGFKKTVIQSWDSSSRDPGLADHSLKYTTRSKRELYFSLRLSVRLSRCSAVWQAAVHREPTTIDLEQLSRFGGYRTIHITQALTRAVLHKHRRLDGRYFWTVPVEAMSDPAARSIGRC